MAPVRDVAAFILARNGGPMSAMRLQKLVYYSQAWSLVWDEVPLFPERIEAWANGPVVPALYAAHRKQYQVSEIPGGDPATIEGDAKETIEAVLRSYGHRTALSLSELTHSEAPWLEARAGLAPDAPSKREITHDAMRAYYSQFVRK